LRFKLLSQPPTALQANELRFKLLSRPPRTPLSLLNSLQTQLFEAVTHLQETNSNGRISRSKLMALFEGLGHTTYELAASSRALGG
jgi:hypothetical protein